MHAAHAATACTPGNQASGTGIIKGAVARHGAAYSAAVRNVAGHARLADAQANGVNTAASATGAVAFPTIEDYVGETPLVRLQRLPGRVASQRNNVILGKLEGNNPAGSVKDRCHLLVF